MPRRPERTQPDVRCHRSIERADLAITDRGNAHSAVSVVEGNTPAKSASAACSRNIRYFGENLRDFDKLKTPS